MVRAEDVISICRTLSSNSIQVWLTGGWGVDALLREEIDLTRISTSSFWWPTSFECETS
jgi:hypothetical protein